MSIDRICHPWYNLYFDDWCKYRLTYEGGRAFVNTYLKKFSSREDVTEFAERKEITYCPAFSKAAINDVKNSIYQRLVDITRTGGSKSYIESTKNNVDLLGSSMTFFMGTKVLPELLSLGRVGVYVDMPKETPSTLQPTTVRPYIYIYKAEDIRCWKYDESSSPNEYELLLLRECQLTYDEETGLPTGDVEIYKLFQLVDNQVHVKIYYPHYNEITKVTTYTVDEEYVLNINKIPFVCLELSHSLLIDIADYQIALLNLASSDILYSLKSNFPFYTEQFHPGMESPYLKKDGEDKEIELSTSSGRRYPLGTERPEFIHPSSEPLLASMQKQEQLQKEIRLLINLAISNLQAKMASAESKASDQQSLESGLSYIGLELENGERKIAEYWALYENNNNVATIKYPEKYNLKTDEERRADCKQYSELMPIVPSKTYQKELAKIISNTLLRNRIADSLLEKIYKEIDAAKIVIIEPDVITKDTETGLVSIETASEIRGYPKGEVEKAKQDHADRLSRIAIAQTEGAAAARGVNDLSTKPGTGGQQEKQNGVPA